MNLLSHFSKYDSGSLLLAVVMACCASSLHGQRPRFADPFQTQSFQLPSVTPNPFPNQGLVAPGFAVPTTQVAPPPATLVAPAFDPFQANTQALPFSVLPNGANTAPALGLPGNPNLQVLPPVQPQTFSDQPIFLDPGLNSQQPFLQAPFFQQPFSTGNQSFPASSQSGQFFQRFRNEFLPRLLERPRIRHTYLPGNNGNEFQIHDTEFATTLTFPRFLFVDQPVRISPGFIAHFWDGPDTVGPFGTGFDFPEKGFSAFLNLDHFSDPNLQYGVETNVTVGIYSDYDHLDSDSLRFTGVGLGWARLSPTHVFKVGIEYFDRVDLKLLPAFGLFIRPTPDLELDLYFPRPRIAQRLPNFRTMQTWMYIAGEYGGGNWTVERIGGLDDRVDINDYRAIVGFEWIGPRGVVGFIETGYVFERELVSFSEMPARKLDLQDTIMLRMGVEF